MSFSSDLLDGFDTLYKRTDGVIKSCTEVASFYKNLAKCEKEYSRALSRLASSQRQEFKKAPAMQKEFGSTSDSWDIILGELEKIAEHHNQFSDKLENDLSKNVLNYVKEKQKAKKDLETNGKKITSDYQAVLDNLKKTRAKYVQLSKEAESAEATHTKGKGDMSMKPSALAKLAAKASQCADKAAAADNEYQQVLNLTNQKQAEYYTTIMPNLLTKFQQFEEDRIQVMKENVEKFASFYTEKPGVYNQSAEVISKAAGQVNVQVDIKAWVNENKTGASVPSDIPYITFDSDQPAVPKPNRAKPKVPGGGGAKIGNYNPNNSDILSEKDWGLTPADQSLSADEKQRKLQQQLDELDKAIVSESKARDGLKNLVTFYASDPVSQKRAEDQVSESEEKLQRLRNTRSTVQSQTESLGGGGGGGGAPRSAAGVIKARGLYDYTATCDTELTFKQGDILVISEQDDSGWWYAELNGQQGFVPNNYVETL